MRASLPVCLRVSLSWGDNHSASLVFLLLISVRRRMAGECQLSLQHLFPANNSLCRCLVLADGSPIVSSLLTLNNNADECHLLVMSPPPPHCVSSTAFLVYADAPAAYVLALLTAALPDVLDGPLILPPPGAQPVLCGRLCEMWAGLLLKVGGGSLPHTASSLSSSFLNSTAVIPEPLSPLCFHSPSPKPP